VETDALHLPASARSGGPLLHRITEHAGALDLHWRRSVVQLVVERVIVKPGSPGSHKYKGRRFNPDDVEIVYRVLVSV
jgi:site-specific DNA recombinase